MLHSVNLQVLSVTETQLKPEGDLVTAAVGNADVLCTQVAPDFTQERIDFMPDEGPSPYQDLPTIYNTREYRSCY